MAKSRTPRTATRKAAGKRTAARKTARARKTAKTAARKPTRKAAKRAARKVAKKAARKAATRPSRRAAAPRRKAATKARRKARAKTATRKVARKASRPAKRVQAPAKRVAARTVKAPITTPPPKPAQAARPARPVSPVRKAALDRERRRLPEASLPPTPPSSLDLDRRPSAARSGRREFQEHLSQHNESGPVLTAGDVDADWEAAYSSGDEAPGGDNPTPDQDVVDEIGRSLGLEYEDNEELKGADKVEARDRHRWELDPASSEDYDDRD